jgi:hypothetical protein
LTASLPGIYLDDLLAAITVAEPSNPRRLGSTLALRIRVVEHGAIRSYPLLPGDKFQLVLPATGSNEFVEHIPQASRLVYSAPSGREADLLTSISRGRLRPTG